ncbi:MAG TPA: response regulator [Ktedonobacteraceae bacterium]|nr:response regulator [Ktedonobacteraceae bacterium]
MVNILVVEDEQSIARLLKETLEIEGYRVATVLNGEDAVQYALRETPHLIILDVMLPGNGSQSLPGLDGYEVIQQLRNHPKTMHIPIIALSALGGPADKIRAYERDVDGFITKPFNTEELLSRVRRQLRRIQQSCLSPLTGLPGGLQVVRAINYKLANWDPWSILYLDLDNFKAFNDVYGFLTGNEMILLVGRICQQIVYEYGNSDDFVGHVGGDDFVVVTTPDCATTLCRHISTRYKGESAALYRPEDLRRGSISGVDRKGRPYQFPLVSLSIGVVNNQVGRLHSIQEVSYLAAEAKRNAKQSISNVSYISSQQEKAQPERISAAGSMPSSHHPPAFAFSINGHTLQDLLHFADEDILAEYEHQVF